MSLFESITRAMEQAQHDNEIPSAIYIHPDDYRYLPEMLRCKDSGVRVGVYWNTPIYFDKNVEPGNPILLVEQL